MNVEGSVHISSMLHNDKYVIDWCIKGVRRLSQEIVNTDLSGKENNAFSSF